MVFEFSRDEVLAKIRHNRDNHLAELAEALDGWRAELIEAIDEERARLAEFRKRAKAGTLRPREMPHDILGIAARLHTRLTTTSRLRCSIWQAPRPSR